MESTWDRIRYHVPASNIQRIRLPLTRLLLTMLFSASSLTGDVEMVIWREEP
jgi:hypothetical protein